MKFAVVALLAVVYATEEEEVETVAAGAVCDDETPCEDDTLECVTYEVAEEETSTCQDCSADARNLDDEDETAFVCADDEEEASSSSLVASAAAVLAAASLMA